MNIELKTERLILKTLDSSYANPVLQYYIRNKEFFRSKVPEYHKDFFSEEYHIESLEKFRKDMESGNSVKLFIFTKNDPGKVIGDVSISNIVRGVFLSCHLGYKLDEEENGKGYASEAVKKITDYAFNELNLHRIEANIMPSNSRSINLIRKLGFEEEGLAKKYLKLNGKWEDHIHYVQLNNKME